MRNSKRDMGDDLDSKDESIVDAIVKGKEEAIKHIIEVCCNGENVVKEFQILRHIRFQ